MPSAVNIGKHLLILVTALAAESAGAATYNVFTNRAAWEAAAGGGVQVETFDAVPVGPLALGQNNVGLIRIDLVENEFLGGIPGDNAIADTTIGRAWQGDVRAPTFGVPPAQPVVVFEQPVLAFGADWVDALTRAELRLFIATVDLPPGEYDATSIDLNDYFAAPGSGFLGFVSDVPVRELTFGLEDFGIGTQELFIADNLSFVAAPAEVPAPSAVTSLLAGLGLLAGLIRFSRKPQGR